MTAEPLKTLNSCPFCGGYATLDIIKRYDIGPYGGGGIYYQYRIICRDCGMVTHTVDEGKQDALIAAWNRRAEPEELPGWMVEKINERLELRKEEVADVVTFNLICELNWVLSLKKEDS